MIGVGSSLFVCTKPYQYLIAELIMDSSNEPSDIIIVDHFQGARRFSENLRKSNIWNNVRFLDDSALGHKSIFYRILFYYYYWRPFVESLNFPLEEYERLYIAHDSVLCEYALAKYFHRRKKEVVLYEEGYGNYVNTNSHLGLKRVLKTGIHIFGIPGDHLGRLRFVNKILLQYPELVSHDTQKALSRKIETLPNKLSSYLSAESVARILCLFGYERVLKESMTGEIHVVLGEAFLSNSSNEITKILHLVESIRRSNGSNAEVMFKPHPGDRGSHAFLRDFVNVLPGTIPFELLVIRMLEMSQVINIYTYGSTAALSSLFISEESRSVKITVIKSETFDSSHPRANKKFRTLLEYLVGDDYETINIDSLP